MGMFRRFVLIVAVVAAFAFTHDAARADRLEIRDKPHIPPHIRDAILKHPASRNAPRPRFKWLKTRMIYDDKSISEYWTRYKSVTTIETKVISTDGPIVVTESFNRSSTKIDWKDKPQEHQSSESKTLAPLWLGPIVLGSATTTRDHEGDISYYSGQVRRTPTIHGGLFPMSVGKTMSVSFATVSNDGARMEWDYTFRVAERLSGTKLDSRLRGSLFRIEQDSSILYIGKDGKRGEPSSNTYQTYYSTDLNWFVGSPRYKMKDGAWIENNLIDFELDATVPRATSRPSAQTTTDAAPQTAPQSPEDRILVMLAQRQLTVLGFDPGPTDGMSGSKTKLAVQAFQTLHGLKPDGAITKELVEKLNKAARAAPAPNPKVAAPEPKVAATAPPPQPAAKPAPGFKFGGYHALVIGNNAYKHLPRLKTAEADARAMAKVLKRDYGFQVKTMVNATRVAIVEGLDELRAKLKASDNLLVYYAGHGWLDQDAERGYWLPVDAKRDSRANWLSNATITDSLKAIRAKHVLVVADSCYSGTLSRGLHITERSPGYLERMAKKRARLALTSGGLEPVADGGGGGHSAFAKALLGVLGDNDGVLDGTQLFAALRRQVMLNAPQTPEYSDIRFAGHEGGDFLFVRSE